MARPDAPLVRGAGSSLAISHSCTLAAIAPPPSSIDLDQELATNAITPGYRNRQTLPGNPLAGALATTEMQAGAAKRAHKLFRSALIDPKENSVAQAEWASSRLTGDIGLRQEQRISLPRREHIASLTKTMSPPP